LLDRLARDEIVGTLAGEDTIFIVTRSAKDAERLQDDLESYFE
jgi:transcriptional regulator of arginine metabolism